MLSIASTFTAILAIVFPSDAEKSNNEQINKLFVFFLFVVVVVFITRTQF